MKRNCIITLLAVFAAVGALADDSTNTKMASQLGPATGSVNDMTGKFGVGFTFGEPIGPSLKYFFNDSVAIDGAFGWSLHDHTDFYMQSDLLWHNFELIPVSQGKMPVYFGAGGLLRFRNSGEGDQFGIRAPVGVSYFFENAPVEIFAEVGPALDLTPSLRGEVTGGIGVRFWF